MSTAVPDLLPGLRYVAHPLLAGELLDELSVEHLLAEEGVGRARRLLRSPHVPGRGVKYGGWTKRKTGICIPLPLLLLMLLFS